MFELSQNNSDPLVISPFDLNIRCPDATLSKSHASMFSTGEILTFGPCPAIGGAGGLVEFSFNGRQAFRKRVQAEDFDGINFDYAVVKIPEFWGIKDQVNFYRNQFFANSVRRNDSRCGSSCKIDDPNTFLTIPSGVNSRFPEK